MGAEWLEAFVDMGLGLWSEPVLPALWIELLCIAGDAEVTHMFAPGTQRHIQTPAFESYIERATEEEKNRFYQLIPAGRLGKTEEYAPLAVYLASDDHYLVGQIISPNGGVVI